MFYRHFWSKFTVNSRFLIKMRKKLMKLKNRLLKIKEENIEHPTIFRRKTDNNKLLIDADKICNFNGIKKG
jgi:hypothetical protein